MGITETAVAVTPLTAAKMPNSAVLSIQAIIKGFSVAAGLPELDMSFDFFGNRCWILVKLTSNTFKGFSANGSFSALDILLLSILWNILLYPENQKSRTITNILT